MHRALALPEIIAAIVKSGSNDEGFLFKCLLVNRLFFEESCRILWYGCGMQYNSAIAGHVTPDICHLGAISSQDRERAQIYAGFIQVLQFWLPADTYPYGDEAEWHSDLVDLRFPQLRNVSFANSDNAASLNLASVIIHYAQLNLEEFHLRDGSQFSDHFLEALHLQSPGLRSVSLSLSPPNSITENGLIEFLDVSSSLDQLVLKSGFDDTWSLGAFRTIERYANLGSLEVPVIKDEWICGERIGFPNLGSLYTSTSARGLELLHGHMPDLTLLDITLHSPSTTLSGAIRFAQLSDLSINFCQDSSFYGTELLQLIQQCPRLNEIKLGEYGDPPQVAGLSDDLMAKIASHMSIVKIFILNVKTPAPLTMCSLRSLGNCPKLETLTISSISIDWDEVENWSDDEVISETIWSLDLSLHEDQPPLPYNEGFDEDQTHSDRIAELALNFLEMFPKMCSFFFLGGGEGEVQFEDRVGDVALGRY